MYYGGNNIITLVTLVRFLCVTNMRHYPINLYKCLFYCNFYTDHSVKSAKYQNFSNKSTHVKSPTIKC